MQNQTSYFDEIVTFGGEEMPRGRMIARLQECAKSTGHPNPQLLVDRYLQGFEQSERNSR